MHAHAGRLEETSAESGKKSCGSLYELAFYRIVVVDGQLVEKLIYEID